MKKSEQRSNFLISVENDAWVNSLAEDLDVPIKNITGAVILSIVKYPDILGEMVNDMLAKPVPSTETVRKLVYIETSLDPELNALAAKLYINKTNLINLALAGFRVSENRTNRLKSAFRERAYAYQTVE